MKKVLIIGMVDSVHLARWLNQFKNSGINFTIFPSKKFKYVHPDLLNLVESSTNFSLIQKNYLAFFGIKELFFDSFLSKFFNKLEKGNRIYQLIAKSNFNLVHLFEIQGAGYLMQSVVHKLGNSKPKILLTNWGSDIYYFQNQDNHLSKIKKVLEIADFYSAECVRDYDLALKYNFRGQFLPCIPNAGGIKISSIELNSLESSRRKLIIVKGYEGEFGRAAQILPAIEEVLKIYSDLEIFFYSLSKVLIRSIKQLQLKYPNRIQYTTQNNPISQEKLKDKFLKSKVYIGASISDGLSTSFLEAIAYGAYPIQTNTSCAIEMIQKGAKGSLVSINSSEITKTLLDVLSNGELMELDRKNNKEFAKKNLSYDKIQEISQMFYSDNITQKDLFL